MTSPVPSPDNVSHIIRRVARDIIMPAFQALSDHQVYEKRPGEVVTEIDLAAEKQLIQQLTDLVPGSQALGEESFEDDPSLIELLSAPGPVWVIDPLDGTKNYTKCNPHFAIIISFRLNCITQAAWIYDPVRDVMISAQLGQGVWGNDKRLEAQGADKSLGHLRGSLGTSLSKRHQALVTAHQSDLPTLNARLRCCGQEYMALAQGEIQFLQYGIRLKPWDHSAGVLIATEAGYHAAFLEDESHYDAALLSSQGMPEGYLMMAPDYQSWLSLRDLLWKT
ncbi:MAG: inositol monophosphatase [Rhodospirillales bacterium]|jgi:fructose-1,6-bisphosphatase/inositol monophosphatase family enzyme|nr:inositol monophosphatase [Rhodospirillales bacterium]MBT4041546.1 inositol monophosphatase [Rhodospirillales bacterium]MBT4627693.1 inositol monophosphatase [Rhodospirillales bacterium]MBT7147517.1 inositol monophosphatase [Rhodospirillales bacterium]MBT7505246.1 inositol monophosphatase [Rhodospirillales bacterium]